MRKFTSCCLALCGQNIPVVASRALSHVYMVWQVHKVLDEIVMGGMVLETDIGNIMESVTKYKVRVVTLLVAR